MSRRGVEPIAIIMTPTASSAALLVWAALLLLVFLMELPVCLGWPRFSRAPETLARAATSFRGGNFNASAEETQASEIAQQQPQHFSVFAAK